MLTRTKIIDAVCDIVGRKAYEDRVRASEGLFYHTDALEWAAIIAFRIGKVDGQACDVIRHAMAVHERDRLCNFDNLPE